MNHKEAETIASEIIKAFPDRRELTGMVPVNVKMKYLKKQLTSTTEE